MIETISFDASGALFYSADELKKENPEFFFGTSASVRDIIKRKNISNDDFIYASNSVKKGWTIGTDSSKRTKLFLSKKWVDNHVYKKDEEEHTERAPDILLLEDHEKFRDSDGNIVEIETRGERYHDKIFFKVKDVENRFKIPNLTETLVSKETNFEVSKHYINFFIRDKLKKLESPTIKKVLFLTYHGLTRLLFVSQNKNAEYFQKWAIEKLFTIQMGDQDEKDSLASSLIGVNSQTVKAVFRANTDKTPVVYLFVVGSAKKLLNNSYSDDDLICKFGNSDDLPRRTDEHQKKFKKEFNVDIELYCYSIIDVVYITKAETCVKNYFKPFKLDYKNFDELVVINKQQLTQMREVYGMIQRSYIGKYAEMNDQIKKLEQELIELKYTHQLELKEKDMIIQAERYKNELKDREIFIRDKEISLKDKEINIMEKDKEILELKLLLAGKNSKK